jgi:nucleotide-binding universal stress UspA family protein
MPRVRRLNAQADGDRKMQSPAVLREHRMYRKILVPLDGSATADRGFEEAVGLARATQARLLLLHVVETFPIVAEMATATTWQQVSDGLQQHGQDLVERARRTAADHGVGSESRIVESGTGRVADAIVACAREAGCDLIVMGTHGRRGFGHLMIGSDAERVARESPVPVMLVRHPEARRA